MTLLGIKPHPYWPQFVLLQLLTSNLISILDWQDHGLPFQPNHTPVFFIRLACFTNELLTQMERRDVSGWPFLWSSTKARIFGACPGIRLSLQRSAPLSASSVWHLSFSGVTVSQPSAATLIFPSIVQGSEIEPSTASPAFLSSPPVR